MAGRLAYLRFANEAARTLALVGEPGTRAAAMAAAALGDVFPGMPRKMRIWRNPLTGRWGWHCTFCQAPASGETADGQSAIRHAARHLARLRQHHEYVARHLGPTIEPTGEHDGTQDTDG